jgi:hypothetical protein
MSWSELGEATRALPSYFWAIAVPGEQRFRSNDSGHFCQDFAPQPSRLHRQPTALIVIQPEPPIAELLPKNPILFAKVVDDVRLTLINPSAKRNTNRNGSRIPDIYSAISTAGSADNLSFFQADPIFGPYAMRESGELSVAGYCTIRDRW